MTTEEKTMLNYLRELVLFLTPKVLVLEKTLKENPEFASTYKKNLEAFPEFVNQVKNWNDEATVAELLRTLGKGFSEN